MKLPFHGRAAAAAFAAAALFMLLPANLLPVITMESIQHNRSDTIVSSIVGLFESGLWPLGVIVFAASIAVPFLKLWGIGWLLLATRRGPPANPRQLTRLYMTLDFIGKWSMLDVFLVAFLTGVVQFGAVASIYPGTGIIAFGAAVVLTMLATHAFDPRTLWRS